MIKNERLDVLRRNLDDAYKEQVRELGKYATRLDTAAGNMPSNREVQNRLAAIGLEAVRMDTAYGLLAVIVAGDDSDTQRAERIVVGRMSDNASHTRAAQDMVNFVNAQYAPWQTNQLRIAGSARTFGLICADETPVCLVQPDDPDMYPRDEFAVPQIRDFAKRVDVSVVYPAERDSSGDWPWQLIRPEQY
ncbi:hypothetical protein CR983_00280 [Candidatus Saccharibacteria bacterium]|nr:MAG: hypothetical protein CR983_00280 [Candidatus Saccharibacteria bacterium]